MTGALEKPVIAAVNGFAMGGGFMLVERTDLRVAAIGAVFEVSEAKRWLVGGYNHGHIANLPTRSRWRWHWASASPPSASMRSAS